MTGCGCNLGAIPAIINATPCQTALYDSWHDAAGTLLQKQGLVGRARYNLCLAGHKAGQYILDVGHWFWAELENLWTALRRATAVLARGTGAAINAAAQGALNGVKFIVKKSQDLLTWLINTFERVGIELLIIGAIIAGVIWFAPDVLELGGVAYADHYGSVAGRAPKKIAKSYSDAKSGSDT